MLSTKTLCQKNSFDSIFHPETQIHFKHTNELMKNYDLLRELELYTKDRVSDLNFAKLDDEYISKQFGFTSMLVNQVRKTKHLLVFTLIVGLTFVILAIMGFLCMKYGVRSWFTKQENSNIRYKGVRVKMSNEEIIPVVMETEEKQGEEDIQLVRKT